MDNALLALLNAIAEEHTQRTGHIALRPWPGTIMPDNGCTVCYELRSALRLLEEFAEATEREDVAEFMRNLADEPNP